MKVAFWLVQVGPRGDGRSAKEKLERFRTRGKAFPICGSFCPCGRIIPTRRSGCTGGGLGSYHEVVMASVRHAMVSMTRRDVAAVRGTNTLLMNRSRLTLNTPHHHPIMIMIMIMMMMIMLIAVQRDEQND